MHCTDGVDYSVFGVLPPYNTIHAQLIDPNGKLVTTTSGLTLTYEGVADPAFSINLTSVGKTNFWQYVQAMFNAPLQPDHGLAGFNMPGASNAPQAMRYDTDRDWYSAEGIPITPFPDGGGPKNFYPMMKLTARDTLGNVLATTNIVLPVSDEMDCSACHASGGSPAAQPVSGWTWDPDPARDVKWNVLKMHDDHQKGNATYSSALAAQGYNALGLVATVQSGTPILCARCHGSNALPGLGVAGVEPLTQAIHMRHANVIDPTNRLALNSSTNRSACYRCHPGAETKCLRGAMGNAVAADGTMEMQCQSCHGSMTDVGKAGRQGWLDEPTCQNCHTGTATQNSGQIRYTNVYSSPGVRRTAANGTFATQSDTPATGLSLYRFSAGHGGLQCEACHNSTHAELPSGHANDNVQSVALQGHGGMLAECTACHASMPSTVTGGPHGLHPIGQDWVGRHGDVAESSGITQCYACHGTDGRGTVLSRALGNRTLTSGFGTKNVWKGFQVSCYLCHNGPTSESASTNHAPVVQNASGSTSAGTAVPIALTATDADGNALTLRVVTQPAHGTASMVGKTTTYTPDPDFSGTESFTFAAWDGYVNSNLGTVTVTVTPPVFYTLSVTKNGTGSGIVSSTPTGINCGATCAADYLQGTVVHLQAQADTNNTFTGWTGGGCSGTGGCDVTMSQAAAVTATFAYTPPSYALSVTKNGTGGGTVSSSPAGISCGSTCTASYSLNTVVNLTANPASGSTFAGWSGACSGTGPCSVTMSQPRSVTATFNATGSTSYALTVTKSGSGTVKSSPAGISCGTTCSSTFASGTVVTLSQTPASGWSFAYWSGACSGNGSCTVTMSSAKSVTAVFSKRRR